MDFISKFCKTINYKGSQIMREIKEVCNLETYNLFQINNE